MNGAAKIKERLTWQDSPQCSPLHPGEHVQMPSIGSHAAPLAHKHVRLQPRPHVPLEQRSEQSTPCQPGVRQSKDRLNSFIIGCIQFINVVTSNYTKQKFEVYSTVVPGLGFQHLR